MKHTLKLKKVLAYTSIESILYQTVLFAHQILLFRFLPTNLYGQISLLFSAVFLAAHMGHLGLDLSITPLFKQFGSSKNLFKQVILSQVKANLIIQLLACLLFALLFRNMLSITYIALGIPFFIAENYKKITKALLHLSFEQQAVAITEVSTLYVYVAIIWLMLLAGATPSLYLICIPLILLSVTTCGIYSWRLYRYYEKLPLESHTQSIRWKEIVSLRAKNFVCQVMKSFYSGNFLVPMVAQYYGLAFAGLIKVISMSAYSLNSIIQHAFGITTDVIMSSLKKDLHKDRPYLFMQLSKYVHHILFIICLGLILHHKYIQYFYCNLPAQNLYILYLLLFIIFSENIVITHEHLFIAEGKSTTLLLSNAVILVPFIFIKYINLSVSMETILITLICARCIHYCFLSFCSWYTWKIRPNLGIKPMYLSMSAAIAFLSFLIS